MVDVVGYIWLCLWVITIIALAARVVYIVCLNIKTRQELLIQKQLTGDNMTIYIDVDGPLANFNQGFHDWYTQNTDVFKPKTWGIAQDLGITDEKMQQVLAAAPKEFWNGLEIQSWARSLVYWTDQSFPRGSKINTLSTAKGGEAIVGKRMWLSREFPCFIKEFHFVDNHEDKVNYCTSSEDVLIDDKVSSCREWRERGGFAILFRNHWNDADFWGGVQIDVRKTNWGSHTMRFMIKKAYDVHVATRPKAIRPFPISPKFVEPAAKVDEPVLVNEGRSFYLKMQEKHGDKTEAQERKDTPVFSGFLNYFPDAVREVARLSRIGNDQHNPGKPLHWDRSKSGDELDALSRHLMQVGTVDTDGVLHSTKVAWRAMANLQKELETNLEKEDN